MNLVAAKPAALARRISLILLFPVPLLGCLLPAMLPA
jgi:hypothetical protein